MVNNGYRKLNERIGLNEAAPKKASVMTKAYENLRGEALRTAILNDFQESLATVKDKNELHRMITEFRDSDAFKILAKGQGAVTRLFNFRNVSVAAFEKICTEAENHCSEKKGPRP